MTSPFDSGAFLDMVESSCEHKPLAGVYIPTDERVEIIGSHLGGISHSYKLRDADGNKWWAESFNVIPDAGDL